MRYVYLLVLFILGFVLSAFLYGGNPKLSDALLAVIVGLLFSIWNSLSKK